MLTDGTPTWQFLESLDLVSLLLPNMGHYAMYGGSINTVSMPSDKRKFKKLLENESTAAQKAAASER